MSPYFVIVGAGIAGVFLSGCSSSLSLPRGPDIYSMAMRAGAPVILVARPLDQRADKQRIGRIGGLKLNLKEDPSELVAKEVVAALHRQGMNRTIGHVAADDRAAFRQVASQTQARGVLAVAVVAISVQSFDALMDPPTATTTLRAILYDPQATVLAEATATGTVQHGVGFLVEKAAAELVGEAIRDAAQRLVTEQPLASALGRL